MASYELIPPSDVRLNGLSREVPEQEIPSDRIQNIISAMSGIALGERDEKHPELPSLVGLAAPQIGVFERIILIDFKATASKANFDLDLRFIIDPQLTKASADEELGREGCYSTGDIGGAVYRATSVELEGYNERGHQVKYHLTDMLARITQHEVDHLHGIRFPDRIRDPRHLHAFDFKSQEFQRYREEWATWDKLLPFEEWLKVKNGAGER